MILLCVVAGLVIGSWLNWLADYLPRFTADRSLRNRPEPRFAFALGNFLAAGIFRRKTKNAIPRLDLGVELLMAFLFAFAWARDGWSLNFFLLVGIGAFYVLIALIDFKYRLIPNVLVFPALAATLLVQFVAPGTNLRAAIVGGAFGLVVFWLAAYVRPGELGFGDVKLAALIGWMLGFPNAVWALLIGVFAGGIAVLAFLLTRRGNLQTRIPYAPFLCLGALSVFAFAPLLTIR
ncbi:MAG: A24 family peptidase [Chloroflexota bacterium]